MLKDLWLPSVYILNLKSYKTLNVFSDFAGKVFLNQFQLFMIIFQEYLDRHVKVPCNHFFHLQVFGSSMAHIYGTQLTVKLRFGVQ